MPFAPGFLATLYIFSNTSRGANHIGRNYTVDGAIILAMCTKPVSQLQYKNTAIQYFFKYIFILLFFPVGLYTVAQSVAHRQSIFHRASVTMYNIKNCLLEKVITDIINARPWASNSWSEYGPHSNHVYGRHPHSSTQTRQTLQIFTDFCTQIITE